MSTSESFDLDAIRTRLRNTTGKQYWRSLEEFAATEGFADFVRAQLPRQANWLDSHFDLPTRRTFLKLMGASLAMAGLGACVPRRRTERIMPYVQGAENLIPGRPLFFATTLTLGGYGTGVLVESHEGRPTKIEGNPDHPASLGATDAIIQARILDMYDPYRSEVVLRNGQIQTWGNFVEEMADILDSEDVRLRVLTETITSPTLAHQLRRLRETYPNAQWHQYEPVSRGEVRAGAQLAFGEVVNTVYRFDQAQVVLSLDANFLGGMPGSVRYAHDFMERRRLSGGQTTMNRLYVAESAPTITGAVSDHRLALRAGQIEALARGVAAAVGVAGVDGEILPAGPDPEWIERWIAAVGDDLQEHAGACVVVAGDEQTPVVHALAHAMNHALGNVGSTVFYTAPVEAEPVDEFDSLQALVDDMAAGQVDLLVVLGGNPVYNAPVDIDFVGAMEEVPLRVHLGLYNNETTARCHWHLPETHVLEMWGDARAYDGTISLIQPLIEPLYEGHSVYEVMAVLLGESTINGQEIVRTFWQNNSQGGDFAADFVANFDVAWPMALEAGLIPGSDLPVLDVSLAIDFSERPFEAVPDAPGEALEIIFRPDPSVWDGRFANNGWLQELPKPLSTLTWDNAALISPATAVRLDLQNEDVVELRYRERTVNAPVWILPGQPDDAVTVYLGYGRERGGPVAVGAGFNAYTLRTADAPAFGTGLSLRKTGERYELAVTQGHHTMEGRPIVMSATLAEYRENPYFAHTEYTETPEISLYPEYEYNDNAWGMSIDLTACIGCNACVVACVAENNGPVVGKQEVARGHEMHWLRVDRYYVGDLNAPEETHFQPVPCMHCEKAPCELVCPVAATVHSDEGLNDMVYNRCVGTRYCSNNCPYKVRRFNFLQYQEWEIESLKLGRNPDVSVRERGVMEKCTYCVQRISAARIAADNESRPIRDGEIQTACQQACPTRAIVFGDINNEDALVTRRKTQPLDYSLLAHLNTQPRTTYLAEVHNPNPALEDLEEATGVEPPG